MSPLSAFPLQGEETFSTITRNALQIVLWHISNRQHLGSPARGDSHAPTMGPVLPSYLHPGELPDRLLFSSLWSDARDLLSKIHLDEFSSEHHGHTEMGRRWKVFQSIPYHSSAAESCRLPDLTQTLQASYCRAPQSLTNHASFSVRKPYPPTLQCALIPTAVSLSFLPTPTPQL